MTVAFKKPENELPTAKPIVANSPDGAPQGTPRSVREALGLSRAEIADLLGMSEYGFSQWEDGKRNPGQPAWRLLFLMETCGQTTLDGLRAYPA